MAALVPFRKRRIDFIASRSQIVKKHFELGVEQILPLPREMREQILFVLEQPLVAR